MSTIDLYEAMSTLRAVRRLKPDPIPEATLNRVLEAASWAPTGGNVQPFRIIVVRDRAKLGRLGELYGTIWADYAAARRRGFDGLPAEEIERQEKNIQATGRKEQQGGNTRTMTDDDGGDARRDDTTIGYTEGDNTKGNARGHLQRATRESHDNRDCAHDVTHWRWHSGLDSFEGSASTPARASTGSENRRSVTTAQTAQTD